MIIQQTYFGITWFYMNKIVVVASPNSGKTDRWSSE